MDPAARVGGVSQTVAPQQPMVVQSWAAQPNPAAAQALPAPPGQPMVVQSWAAPAAAAPIMPSGTRKAPLSVLWP